MTDLFLHCSLGSLGELGESLDQQLDAVASARFDGVESWIGPDTNPEQLALATKQRNLRLGGAGHLPVEAEPEPLFAAAAKAGALYLELQVDGYWQPDPWILRRTTDLMTLGQKYHLPFFLETHRGRYTQDMRRTLWLLEQLPALQLCGDFSHYASSCELVAPWPPAWKNPLYQIARRCSMIHARMNSGQRVQDPLPTIKPAQQKEFLDAWAEAFHAAAANHQKSFTATTELLPPDYQIVADSERIGNL